MNDRQTAPEDCFATALASLRDAYGQAAAVIRKDAEAQQAFDSATALADALRQLAEDAANLRARAAARIAEEEKLSLSVLATRIGVSKARADQLVKSVKDADSGDLQEGEGNTNA